MASKGIVTLGLAVDPLDFGAQGDGRGRTYEWVEQQVMRNAA